MTDLEPEAADAVALVLAHVRGDEQVIRALLDAVEVRDLFAVTVGLLVALLHQAGVDDATLAATLAGWQERRRESL